MAFKLDDEKNWGEFVHEHALDEMADQVEANRVKNVEQDQRLDEHDQHLAKLDEDLATETRERKAADQEEKTAREAADEAEKEAREQADSAEKQAREQADQEEKTAREAADEAEKEAREKADADEAQARQAADDAEKTAREQADQAEKTAREAADEAEKEARQAADTAEQTAREQADQGLQTQVTANTTKNTEQDTRLGSIESKNADQDNRLANNDEKDAEQDTRLTNNDTRDNQQDARLDGLETKNTTQDSRLAALEAKPSEDIYPTAIEILDADYEAGKTARIKITQNDESKSLEENLPQPALQYEDETGKLTLTYLNESNSVTLPKPDTEKLTTELAEQEHLREIDNKVIQQANNSGVHDQSWFTVTKHGGEFVTALKQEDNGDPRAMYDLEYWLQPKRTDGNTHRSGKLAFVNSLTEDVYLEDAYSNNKVISGPLNTLTPWLLGMNVAYNVVSSTDTGKTVAVVAPTGTVLYQVGYEDTNAPATLLNIFLYGLKSLSSPVIGTSRNDVAPTLENYRSDFSKLTQGNLDTNGAVHLPLTFAPDLMTDNITEIDVPEQIKQKVPELQPGYELRMYELTKITL